MCGTTMGALAVGHPTQRVDVEWEFQLGACCWTASIVCVDNCRVLEHCCRPPPHHPAGQSLREQPPHLLDLPAVPPVGVLTLYYEEY